MLLRDHELERQWSRISRQRDDFLATYKRLIGGYDEAAYFESGRRDVADWLHLYGTLIERRAHALDIGTGLGRLAFGLAEHFDDVVATDIVEHYLDMVRERAQRVGVANITAMAYDGPWDKPDHYDMVLAICVLTQINNDNHLQSYLDNIAASLSQYGIAILHFDTRRRGLKYHVREHIPDSVLPARWRKGFRRIRRTPNQLAAMIARSSMTIAAHTGIGTTDTYYIVRRTSRT